MPASVRAPRRCDPARRRAALLGLLSAAIGNWGWAAIPNGGFETGDLSGGWTTGGTQAVEVLGSASFSTAIAPPQGSRYALLATGPADLGGQSGNWDSNAYQDDDRATLSIEVCVPSLPARIAFSWAFLTAEVSVDPPYDDFFYVELVGPTGSTSNILARSAALGSTNDVSPFANTPGYDSLGYLVNSTGATDGNSFVGRTPFQAFTYNLTATGTHRLTFAVADQRDALYDSGLLLDAVDLPALGPCAPSVVTQLTATAQTELQLKNGAIYVGTGQNTAPAASQDTGVIALVSDANLTGDNPNLASQIYVIRSGGQAQRITAMADGQVSSPALSSDGRFLAFAADGDPKPGAPGNADRNLEIFLYDRTALTLTQVTNTSGCTNERPTVGSSGTSRTVAFGTDCRNLASGYNADGNREVVYYDGTLRTRETTGCSNWAPAISRDMSRMAFLSTCNLTGGNADRSVEVFHWRLSPSLLTQVTSTSGQSHDSITLTGNGRNLFFVSTANLSGLNPSNALVPYRYNVNNGSVTGLATADPTVIYPWAAVEDTGRYVGLERIDVLTGYTDLLYVDTNDMSEHLVLNGVGPEGSFAGFAPRMGIQGGVPQTIFQGSGDFAGGNPDGSIELWRGRPLP
jgi:Tol biopolymer transport system component